MHAVLSQYTDAADRHGTNSGPANVFNNVNAESIIMHATHCHLVASTANTTCLQPSQSMHMFCRHDSGAWTRHIYANPTTQSISKCASHKATAVNNQHCSTNPSHVPNNLAIVGCSLHDAHYLGSYHTTKLHSSYTETKFLSCHRPAVMIVLVSQLHAVQSMPHVVCPLICITCDT
jgi:hypothetical protein